ncbi:MAG: adenylate kinase [Kiritimatiellae bacterium]|nr:adenylate kinase [Kiritimatiellia bacterium]
MNTIILLGAPGAGKGTTAEGIKAKTRYVHISTGDMLREAVRNGTPLGREAKTYMERGELVPDDLILKLVEARLQEGGRDESYMFDGFPRTIEQAKLLAQLLAKFHAKVDYVFFLDAARDVLIDRLTGRRICRECGTNYHVRNIPPKREGVCDACGGELYQRPDDTEETIVNRLNVFRKETEGLITFYDEEGVLVRVDSAQHRDKITAEILEMLEELAGP